MFETFCLRLAAGLALGLLVLPAGVVQPRFYRIQLLIVLGLGVAAVMAAWESAGELFWPIVGFALAATVVGNWCHALEGAPAGRAILGLGAVAYLLALVALPAEMTTEAALGGFLDHATSAALLGTATTAMLMGHWYLISPTMSLKPLMRLLAALFVAVGARMLASGFGLGQWGMATSGSDQVTWLWLSLRWLAGFVGPLALGWMAWQSARIRSTQSATGILYVVVIFVFIGELTGLLLRGHTGYGL